MDRRQFLKVTGAGAACFAVAGVNPLEAFAADKKTAGAAAAQTAAKQAPLAFVVTRGGTPDKNYAAALRALGGMSKFVTRGDVVVVKPNIGWDRTPEQAANTDPTLVGAVVKSCYDAGAKKVKVFDYPCNDPRRTYVRSGIAAAAKAAGAEVSFMDERKFKQVDMKGTVLKTWPVYSEALDCDRLINVPVAKHHGSSRLTMSLKNWMGVIGDPRGRLHQDFDHSLADLGRFFKPSLTVLDATRILTAYGPQGGDTKDVRTLNTLVVGVDQVAIDSYGTSFFGMKGAQLGYLVEAARLGVGQVDLGKVRRSVIDVA
jgi:uncharacterized protein (DUF362 family)